LGKEEGPGENQIPPGASWPQHHSPRNQNLKYQHTKELSEFSLAHLPGPTASQPGLGLDLCPCTNLATVCLSGRHTG
jgi:hypothetical protein